MMTKTKTTRLAPSVFTKREKQGKIILFLIEANRTTLHYTLQVGLARVYRYAISAMPNNIHCRRRPLADSKTDIPPSSATYRHIARSFRSHPASATICNTCPMPALLPILVP